MWLRRIKRGYVEDGNPEGYSQEYLNQPVDISNLFFNKDYFFDFERASDGKTWVKQKLEYFAAADFAISEKETADYTAIVVGGMSPESIFHIVDVKRFKGDADKIIEELLATQKMYNPYMFTFESGQISQSIGAALNTAMLEKNVIINVNPITPTQSKTMRARSIQARHKCGAIRYDKRTSWYDTFEAELMMVADSGPRGRNDDQFDAFAYLGLTIDQYWDAQSDEELEEEEFAEEWENYHSMGRDKTTGY